MIENILIYKNTELIHTEIDNLTNLEKKIIDCLIHQIRKGRDRLIKIIKVTPKTLKIPLSFEFHTSTKEIRSIIDFKRSGNEDVKKALNELCRKRIKFKFLREKDNIIQYMSLLSFVEIIKNTGDINYRLQKEIVEKIIMPEKFAKFDIKEIRNLKNKYSVSMYEIAADYKDSKYGYPKTKLNQFKSFLGLPENTYSSFKDFNNYVLKKCKNEINKFTDLNIDYEFFPKGKTVKKTHIKLIIKKKQKAKAIIKKFPHSAAPDNEKVFNNEINPFNEDLKTDDEIKSFNTVDNDYYEDEIECLTVSDDEYDELDHSADEDTFNDEINNINIETTNNKSNNEIDEFIKKEFDKMIEVTGIDKDWLYNYYNVTNYPVIQDNYELTLLKKNIKNKAAFFRTAIEKRYDLDNTPKQDQHEKQRKLNKSKKEIEQEQKRNLENKALEEHIKKVDNCINEIKNKGLFDKCKKLAEEKLGSGIFVNERILLTQMMNIYNEGLYKDNNKIETNNNEIKISDYGVKPDKVNDYNTKWIDKVECNDEIKPNSKEIRAAKMNFIKTDPVFTNEVTIYKEKALNKLKEKGIEDPTQNQKDDMLIKLIEEGLKMEIPY